LTSVAAILSSGSRHDTPALIALLADRLGRRCDLSISVVSSSKEATEAARAAAPDADVVVAVGGDGTVADVATGILGSDAALGIVPAGSTNITARSLGVPSGPRAAIDLLAGPHRSRTVDVGLSGDRCFLHMAGAGVDAEIFRLTSRDWKRRVGWLAYLPPAASAVRLESAAVTVSADEETMETRSALVLIANGGAAIAPAFKLHRMIELDDGWLDVLIFTAVTPPQIAATLARLGSRQLEGSPHLIWRRASRVVVRSEPALAVELDGDVRGQTPADFSIAAGALRVIVQPASYLVSPGGRREARLDQPPR
jgi:diacylglycerol kinase (ATP)